MEIRSIPTYFVSKLFHSSPEPAESTSEESGEASPEVSSESEPSSTPDENVTSLSVEWGINRGFPFPTAPAAAYATSSSVEDGSPRSLDLTNRIREGDLAEITRRLNSSRELDIKR